MHKISLFANDRAIMLSNPKAAMRVLMKELRNYGKVTGFKNQ